MNNRPKTCLIIEDYRRVQAIQNTVGPDIYVAVISSSIGGRQFNTIINTVDPGCARSTTEAEMYRQILNESFRCRLSPNGVWLDTFKV